MFGPGFFTGGLIRRSASQGSRSRVRTDGATIVIAHDGILVMATSGRPGDARPRLEFQMFTSRPMLLTTTYTTAEKAKVQGSMIWRYS